MCVLINVSSCLCRNQNSIALVFEKINWNTYNQENSKASILIQILHFEKKKKLGESSMKNWTNLVLFVALLLKFIPFLSIFIVAVKLFEMCARVLCL